MSLPMITGLRRNAWANMSNAGRWSALRDLEKQLAAQENRPAAELLPMTPDMRSLDENGEPLIRGQYDSKTNSIYIDPALVNDEEPFTAVETTFHEARHAYQAQSIDTPGFHPDEQQVKDWQTNFKPGVYEQRDYSLYRWQPVEADAKEIARQRTDELYEDQFEGDEGYADHKAQCDAEIAWDQEQAAVAFGTPEVEIAAKNAMYERDAEIQQQEQQAPSQQEVPELGQDGEATTQQVGAPPEQVSIEGESVSAGEDDDASQQASSGMKEGTEQAASQDTPTDGSSKGSKASPDEGGATTESVTGEAEASTASQGSGDSAEPPSAASEDYDYSYGYGA